MNKRLFFSYRIPALACAFLCCFCVCRAQSGNRGYYNQGNRLFENKNYFEAAQCYEKYLGAEKKARPEGMPFAVEKKRKGKANLNPRQEAIYHLAESYLNLHDYVRAEKWFREATRFSTAAYPLCGYWYGVSLRANGKYAEASTAITAFLDHYTILDQWLRGADRELENLKYIQSQMAEENKDRFMLLPGERDGKSSAYALTVQNGDTVVFTSIHAGKGGGKNSADSYRNDLFATTATDGVLGRPSGIRIPETNDLQNGLACFTADGNTMFFTRWRKQDGKTNSAIYRCEREDSGWSEPVRLASPVNTDGYNSTQPFVTADNYLLFSSDRPGGSGNYDLWYARLDSNREAYSAVNMGSGINTPGDEESPYYHPGSGTLVFASNGRTGMGGFDIYYANAEFNFTHFGQPENAGYPINSSKDDLYFISTDEDNLWNSGWLSSDRSTNCCLALFSVRENNKQMISGSVTDGTSKKPLAAVRLTVTDTKHGGRLLANGHTDSLGHYHFELSNISRFRILAEKEGYVSRSNQYTVHIGGLVDTVNNGTIGLVKETPAVPVSNESKEAPTLPVSNELKALSRSKTVGNFAYKKAVLSAGAFANLDSLAELMKENPSLVIRVEGYTDGIGGKAYNKRLALARAEACIRYLTGRGVPAARLVGIGMGECCPLVPETMDGRDNAAAREINRRVEYKIVAGTYRNLP